MEESNVSSDPICSHKPLTVAFERAQAEGHRQEVYFPVPVTLLWLPPTFLLAGKSRGPYDHTALVGWANWRCRDQHLRGKESSNPGRSMGSSVLFNLSEHCHHAAVIPAHGCLPDQTRGHGGHSVCPSHLSICLSPNFFWSAGLVLSVGMSVRHLSIHPSICVCFSLSLFLCASLYLFVFLSVSLSVCLYMYICPSDFLTLCLFIGPITEFLNLFWLLWHPLSQFK